MTSKPLIIGHATNVTGIGGLGKPFSGGLDEIALYDYRLSAAQVLAHYNAGV